MRFSIGFLARVGLILLLGGSTFLFGVSGAEAARLATSAGGTSQYKFAVDTTVDAHDVHPGDGLCADRHGRCTLRAAIEAADSLPATSTVRVIVPAGYYSLSLGTLTVGAAGTSAIGVTITGAGPTRTVIAANQRFGVMAVTASASVTVGRLTITGGNAGDAGYGGGILSSGTLTLFHVTITGNQAAAGGGVCNAGGSLVVDSSEIEDNNGGPYGGGGIQNGGPSNVAGSVRIVSSVISDNTTSNEGGGIFSGQNGHPPGPGRPASAITKRCPTGACRTPVRTANGLTLMVIDTAVVGNVGSNGGGGIAAVGPAQIIGSLVTDNSAGGAIGGGLFDVTSVRDSVISGNSATSGGGIEVFPTAQTTIEESTLNDNKAKGYGGAIDESGVVIIDRSTLADNAAGSRYLGQGSAVVLEGGAELQMTNSTVAGNTTNPPGGGAIFNYGGAATLAYDTFSDNSVSITGGGYTLANASIFSAGQSEPACSGPLHETVGFNLDSDASCGLSLQTDEQTVNPLLGALSDNGGPTETEALLAGSPAINHGGLPTTAGCPLVDQRGATRPFGPACDIGAYERH